MRVLTTDFITKVEPKKPGAIEPDIWQDKQQPNRNRHITLSPQPNQPTIEQQQRGTNLVLSTQQLLGQHSQSASSRCLIGSQHHKQQQQQCHSQQQQHEIDPLIESIPAKKELSHVRSSTNIACGRTTSLDTSQTQSEFAIPVYDGTNSIGG